MHCSEGALLLEQYKKAVDEYVLSVMKYRALAVGLPVAEFELIQRACDLARRTCEVAFKALRQHQADHACSLGVSRSTSVLVRKPFRVSD